jgi:hypothetical protein
MQPFDRQCSETVPNGGRLTAEFRPSGNPSAGWDDIGK